MDTFATVESEKCIFHSNHDVPKDSTERVKDCQHCSPSLLADPVLPESASTPSGNDMTLTNRKHTVSNDYNTSYIQLLIKSKIKAAEVVILCTTDQLNMIVRRFLS